jgi:hypothetical protein
MYTYGACPNPPPKTSARGENRPNGMKNKMKSLFAKTQKIWFAKIWRTRKLGNFGLLENFETFETLVCKNSEQTNSETLI